MTSSPTGRTDVEFESGDAVCRAWLYGADTAAPRPVIIMAHGLGAIREMRLDAYAERFSEAGYACLVFDYRHFGASGGEPRQLLDIGRQLEDWNAAIAFARTRTDVDTSQIILWGTSFGGGHVIATAAGNPAVSAVIAQCPFTDGVASVLAMNPITSARVTAAAIADTMGHRLGRAPVLVALSGPARSAALMTAPDVVAGYGALIPEGSLHRNEVAARIGLRIPFYRPGARTGDISCPIMFSVCETDSVAPAKATLRHARRAPRGEVKLYPEGHFEIYLGEPFERVIADQIAFLHKHVPVLSAS